jgi:HlyD family secretion protein
MRRIIVIILVVILIGAGGYFLYQRQAANGQQAFEVLREATVERDRIQATVNATGSIEPESLVSLTFGAAGRVQEVKVVRGQQVEAGEVLATLNAEELGLLLQQAEEALRVQELTLEQRRNPQPGAATLAAAQADIDAAEGNLRAAEGNLAAAQSAVLQAQAQVAQLSAGAGPGEIATAEAQVVARQAEYDTIRTQYNTALAAGLAGAPEEQLRAQREAAEAALDAAKAQLEALQAGARPADLQAANAGVAAARAQVQAAEGSVAVATANVARAEAAYARLTEAPSDAELAILEAQVASARTSVDLARLRVEQATIVAPMAGKVANILINVGEQSAPGAPAITLVNEDAFHIEVSVDEIDIDQLELGQDVEITLDALPDSIVHGTVADIAPTAAPGSTGIGVVSYLVTINIEAGDVDLRPGMTANASIVVEEIDDVVVIPNWAIRLDRETGEAFVNVLQDDGSVTETVVETGLRNDQVSQIVSGLEEGDVVVVTDEREQFSIFGS